MKAESLYIQKLTYDENTGNEIIGLFPSESNPAIVSSYTYDAKRMGGAPTLTATIYSSEPLQWKKEEFVEYNGDRFFASYTPNSTKDNSSRMWKSEITFTSRRELLDNTLFFDVVVDDVDTQNKDRYRSNQTKFTFGGTIHEFVARINSSMAYCGLYRPTDVYKGYYVVVDEGYGTEEVKEVSFEDQYLTDVLQLINTTFELDYYWVGNVCHVGKVQHDLTDTPIKYGSSDALISVSKENANYKIVDMITGYGSSDNLPYYYPNDDEFGEAVFNTENFSKSLVSSISLGDVWKWNNDIYNNTLILGKNSKDSYTANVFGTSSYLITNFGGKDYKGKGEESKNVLPTCSMGEEYIEHNSSTVSRLVGSTTIWTLFEFTSSAKEDSVKMDGLSFIAKETDSALKFGFEFSYEYAYYVGEDTNIDTAYKSIQSVRGGGSMSGEGGGSFGNSGSDVSNGWVFGDNITGLSNYTKSSKKEHTFERNSISTIVIACKITATNIKKASGTRRMNTVSTSISGSIELTHKPSSVYYFETSDGYTQPYDESGININRIDDIPHKDLTFSFDGTDWNASEGGENNAAKITITDRVWLAPSSVLMPSIYRNTKGAERFYYALNNTHKLPSGSGYYEFVNLYKKGNPHQGTVTFDDIKPTINGIVNAEGQLFGEIADVAFDKEDSDVKDSDGKYIHNYFYIKLHKFNGDFGFDLFAHALASEPAKINLIKSHGCPACSFVIYKQPSADNSKCYNCVSVDENGNLKQVRTDKNDYIFANASDAYEDKLNQDSTQKELWIAVQKDTSTLGIVMPNASAGFKPQKGDLFVITGIKPPKVLVTAAEKRLDDALIKHMSENNTDQFNYSVKFSRIFLQENPDFASKLNENAKLSIQIQGDSDSDGNLISHEVFVSNYSVKVDSDELAEVEIELVNSLEVTKSDTKQIIDAVKGETVKSLSGMVGGNNTNNFNASITDKMYLSKLKDDTANGTITFQKIQKFLQGLLIGGGSWTPDAEGRSHLITDYLEVRMKAIFEELVINKTSTIGGKEIISPAGGVVAHKVEEVTVTYNNVSQKAYRCYFLAEQEGDAVDNDFAVGDQVRSESFNVRKGTYHKVGNHFYWRLVIGRDEDPVELEGKKYHYIDLSDTDCATASDVPAKGDVLNQCGNRTDVERQNCLIFSAVDTYSPSISLYHGINSFSFANREYVEYGVNKQTNKAFFNVYGDMYVGDRPTKENGYEGSSYIRYDSSTKQLSVKGKISAKSTVDGKELSQYIKENTDDTVANEAKKAAEDAQKAAQTAQTNITNLGNTVTGNKKDFDNYVTNGYLEPSEIAAMAQDSKRLEDDFAAAQKSYNEVKEAEVLANTNELIDLKTAFDTLTTAKTELVTYLSDISARYNKADTNGKATIVSAVGTKFTNFQSAYASFYDKLGLANAYITRKIYGDLGVVIGDVATYQYLKKVLADSVETEINGGLILTSLIALRDPDTKRVESGINGVIDKTAKGNGIATWWGGYMNDGEVVGFDKKEDYSKQAATSLVRFDGSGYLANGAIWWGTDGRVHADPTSFIISEKNLGAYLTFFEPTWKSGSAGTSVADLVSLKPNAPFTKLGVSGDATFEGAITFHGIKLTYDATNKAIKVDGNLYATGGISAYGASDAGGGGGLNASVISYARIIEGSYTDADLTSIPNAYAIKAISSRIDNIATELGGLNLSWNNITGKPSTFTPSAHTHKWADITDRITKVSQLTNDAGYLTTHQSLASYYTKTEIDAKGYTTNKGTVTSVALTLPTGLACATKTITTSGTFAITLASGYSIPTTAKQTAWDGAVSAKHTHSNKSVLDGITSAKVTHWDSAYNWYALMTTDEETADGIINKWNEVVTFLSNIAQTDTLSGIVDGINKSISDEVTRAKKAEGVNASGISANKTNITTLQGYFTSGSAKKALQLTNARKLWGNSFNGTADINGSIIVPSGKYISIGNIKMEYDATNKALKITNTTTNEVANLYTSGGVSAYGVGTSSSSGGGLNGSVKAYADAIRLTTENLSEIASAYSVAKLYSEIQNVASAVPSISVSVPTGGNALTGATYDASTGVITFTKGTFLTAHQSLGGYVNAIAVSGSGNAVTAITKSGKTITFTKGATYLTSHQSLAAYLKSADAASTYAVVGHTHKVKINGAEKTINPSTGTIVDLGTYLTSHQSLAAYMKTTDANNTFSKIGHTHGYASSVKLGQTSYSASNNVISLPAYPTALKSPTAITIQANGTSLGSYDGSTAKTFNLTYANVGAASAGHNHDSVYSKLHHTHPYLPLSGGTLTGGLTVNSNVTSSGIGTFKVLRVGSVDIKVDDSGNLYIINKDGKTAANFYATGGITAYGASDGTSSGGGLNGSVKSYADALKLASESLSEIASAYSIKALDSRIVSLEGGSAMDVSVSGSGNAVTAISKSGTTISVTKGITFLTSHQSLDGYVNEVATSGTGNAITSVSKSGKKLAFTKGATFLTSHQSLSAYLKSADAANTYLKLSGGAMTGNIRYKGSKNTYDMIKFVDNNVDVYGNGICIGGSGLTIIGGGESASEVLKQHTNGGDENMIVANDAAIDFFSNMNSGWDSRKAGSFDTSGYWNGVGFKKNNSNDNYVLTGGGGHKAISTLSVSYASSAGSANSVAWGNVNGRPTKVSQFTNDSNYATQSWVTGKGYLTSHQDISGKVNRTGDYLDTDSDRWWMSNSKFGINLHNSDIVGVNSIYTSDVSNGPEESISFKRSNGNYDTLRMADGVIWFGTDYALNKTINEYQILHTNNISMSSTSDGFINTSVAGVTKQAYIYAIGSIDGYNSYPDGRTTSINDYSKGLNRLFLTHATSSLQANQKPLGNEGHILHFGWDNSSGWDSQLAISNNGDKPYIAVRAQYNGTWRNWYGAALLKFTNYITGNGGLMVERTDKNLDTYIGVSNGTYDIRLMIGSGNVNRGIYDVVRDNWMLYRDSSTNIYMNGNVLATGGITAYSSSDIRLKQDLRKLDYLGIIKAMGGTFGFAWKKDNTRSIGWIAQHVLCNPHLKDIVETDEKGYYKINYWSPKLIATAFGAIEQVGDEVSRLKARVVFLESEVQRLSGDKEDYNKKRLDNKNINLLN